MNKQFFLLILLFSGLCFAEIVDSANFSTTVNGPCNLKAINNQVIDYDKCIANCPLVCTGDTELNSEDCICVPKATNPSNSTCPLTGFILLLPLGGLILKSEYI
jgi:hypothetical protein